MEAITTATITQQPPTLKPYSYFKSSCSFRVRFSLHLKGLNYVYKAVNLLKGEQFSPEFVEVNPIGYVPALVDGDLLVSDSFAILLYLEEKYPQHPLLPANLQEKASITKYIGGEIGEDERIPWVQQHIGKGFAALEKLLGGYAGKFATGDEIFLVDLFIAPQIHAAVTRFKIDMTQYPTLSRLYESYNELPAFQAALPENQPDAPK
ncbi:hypothetical protein MKX01_016794 [Papaver californicum]|nr:hypothetical protein MKX01_016794 [Papaver californicum]